jgi:ribose-phosphate pyrophosphokinase
MEAYTIFAGTTNPALAAAIAHELGVCLGGCDVARYPDGEVAVKLLEPVRRKAVFIVQPTAPPVEEHLIELLAIVDACRRAAATHITVVVPYFGYARMDKRHGQREPITASMVATLLQAVGVDQVICTPRRSRASFRFPSIACRQCRCWPSRCATGCRRTPSWSPRCGTRAHGQRVRAHTGPAGGGAAQAARERDGDPRDPPSRPGVRPALSDHRRYDFDWRHDCRGGGDSAGGGRAPRSLSRRLTGCCWKGRARLDHPGISAVFVTDSASIPSTHWPQLHAVAIAPLLAQAIRRFVADGPIDDRG